MDREAARRKPRNRPVDVFMSLVEVEKATWSLGNGIAHHA